MAKRAYKQPSVVSGLSVNDIISMSGADLSKLSLSDLRKVTGRLVSAGNKRIRRLEQAGLTPSSLAKLDISGGAFSTKGKDVNQLRAEFVRARQFLKNKTSTVSGYKKQLKDTEKRLQEKGVNVEPGTAEKLLNLYSRLKETNPEVSTRALKYTALKTIANEIRLETGDSTEEILANIRDELRKQYEKNEDLSEDVSEFFEPFNDIEDL